MDLDHFYLSKEEPHSGCLLALRNLILQQDDEVTETRKWGMPCFCFKKKMFCFLWTDKKTEVPYILFVEGKHLSHPELTIGNRSRMKTFSVNPYEDIPLKTIQNILESALGLYKKGIVPIR